MGWKDRFTFRQKVHVEREVQGTTFRFYPNRVRLLPELAEVSKPIAQALGVLFDDRSRDNAVREKRMVQGDTTIVESVVDGITVEVSRARAETRRKAIDDIVEAASDARNRLMLGRLLMDSLRDEFAYHPERPAEDVEQWLDGDGKDYPGVDLPLLAELVQGWIAANAKVFGTQGEKLVAEVRGRLGDLRGESPSEIPPPTSGSSSRTPSSASSQPASPSPT